MKVIETKIPDRLDRDASPLIHLEELGCLDLLRDFPEVHVAV